MKPSDTHGVYLGRFKTYQEELLHADNLDALLDRAQKGLEEFGFNEFVLWLPDIDTPASQPNKLAPLTIGPSRINQKWLEYYFSRPGYHEVNPFRDSNQFLIPFKWDLLEMRKNADSKVEENLFDDTIAAGYRTGLIVPVHMPSLNGRGCVNLTHESVTDMQSILCAKELSIIVMKRMTSLQLKEKFSKLTQREQEALRLKAQGYSTKVVAALMQVSYATALSYLDSAKNKLGARNLPHAIAQLGTYQKS